MNRDDLNDRTVPDDINLVPYESLRTFSDTGGVYGSGARAMFREFEALTTERETTYRLGRAAVHDLPFSV